MEKKISRIAVKGCIFAATTYIQHLAQLQTFFSIYTLIYKNANISGAANPNAFQPVSSSVT